MPKVFAGSAAYPPAQPGKGGPVLTIGNFDGVHRGHHHLLDRVKAEAARLGVPSCVYTFEPPPRVILAPKQHRRRISPWPDKVRLLGEAGIDHIVVERFTRAFAQHSPAWFAREIMGRRLHPSAVVVGYDFRFGRARAGDVALLRKVLPELPVHQVSAWELPEEEDGDGAVVSSSAIRKLVEEGRVDEASHFLGRPHVISGTVVEGDRRGRTMGFPTANLETDAELLPARGVYAVRARVDLGEWMPAVANLGTRPTFDGRQYLVEVHLLDRSIELYGRQLDVAFMAHIREEQTFEGADQLKVQIREDVAAARELLGESWPADELVEDGASDEAAPAGATARAAT